MPIAYKKEVKKKSYIFKCHRKTPKGKYRTLLLFHTLPTALYFVCVLYVYRCCNLITQNVCAHGKPTPTVLTEEDLALFAKQCISIPSHHTVTVVSKIHLITPNRVITATPASRGFLRDNSGIVYVDNAGTICYGQLQKLLLFDSACNGQQHAFAAVVPFRPTLQKLCKDAVTIYLYAR